MWGTGRAIPCNSGGRNYARGICLPGVDFANEYGEPWAMSANDVRERRIALRLTQVRLAALAGVSDETVRKIEQGKPVGPTSIRAVLDALTEKEMSDAEIATKSAVRLTPRVGGVAYSDAHHRPSRGLSVDEYEVVMQAAAVLGEAAAALTAAVALLSSIRRPDDVSTPD